MSITIKILKRAPGARPTLYATRDLDMMPVTIGRDAACTIALEDPNKHMSRFHVEIDEEGGTYWMSVLSKVNPVMVKGRRYGPGTRLTLQSGDSFELAEYEVQVVLQEPAAAAAAKPAPQPAGAPPPSEDSLSQGLGPGHASAEDKAERLFNESTFVGDPPQTKPPTQAAPRQDGPPPEETFIPQQAAEAPPAAPASAPPTHALRAFFEGAGLPLRELSPMQADRMLRDCGGILRAAVEGIMMLLLARAEMRKQFAPEERTIGARDNNPLRLMSDPGDAMDFLFDPGERTDGFLDPVQALGEACEDLRAHELALMAGMRAAVLGVAEQEKLFMGAYQAQLRRLKGGR